MDAEVADILSVGELRRWPKALQRQVGRYRAMLARVWPERYGPQR